MSVGVELSSRVHKLNDQAGVLPFQRQYDVIAVAARSAVFDDVVEEFSNAEPRGE